MAGSPPQGNAGNEPDDNDDDLVQLAKNLAAFGPQDWDALEARLASAGSLSASTSGVHALVDRLADNLPGEKLTWVDAHTLIPVLVIDDRRERFKKIATADVLQRVEALRYRHGSVIGGLWSIFTEDEDWSRLDVDFLLELLRSGDSLPRVRVLTTRKDGERLFFETTSRGFLRYVSLLLGEVTKMPSELSARIEPEPWADFLATANKAIELAERLRNQASHGEADK